MVDSFDHSWTWPGPWLYSLARSRGPCVKGDRFLPSYYAPEGAKSVTHAWGHTNLLSTRYARVAWSSMEENRFKFRLSLSLSPSSSLFLNLGLDSFFVLPDRIGNQARHHAAGTPAYELTPC